MNRILHIPFFALVLVGSVFSAIATGQSIVQTIEADGDLTNGMFRFSIEPFDTMNGSRALSSIEFQFDGLLDVEIEFTNFTALDLSAGDWNYDVGVGLVVAFDKATGFEEGGPVYELDGLFENEVTGELSAGSGGMRPPLGNPTPGAVTHLVNLLDDIQPAVESTYLLSYFESDVPISGGIVRFQTSSGRLPLATEGGFIDPIATFFDIDGTLTITYNWGSDPGPPEDCNGDGKVDFQDVSCICGDSFGVLENLLNATNLANGDTDGDGNVGFSDFLNLSANFGRVGSYSDGDLNCDGEISFGDFLILSSNFGQSADLALHSVPEPNAHPILLLLLFVGCLRRTWNRGAARLNCT